MKYSAILFFLLAPFFLPAQESKNYLSLKFKITEGSNKSQPIPGVGVKVTGKAGIVTQQTSSSAGLFNLSLPLNEEYTIYLSTQGYEKRAVSVSTKVPSSKSKMDFNFSQIEIPLNKEDDKGLTVIKSVSEIFYDENQKKFVWNTKSSKTVKPIPVEPAAVAPKEEKVNPAKPEPKNEQIVVEKKTVPEQKKENTPPAKPSPDAVEKVKADAELKTYQEQEKKKKEEEARSIAEAKEKKAAVQQGLQEAAAEEDAKKTIKDVNKQNEDELKAKKIREQETEEEMKTLQEEKAMKEKRNVENDARQKETNTNRKNKYEKVNPFTEMMNAVDNYERIRRRK